MKDDPILGEYYYRRSIPPDREIAVIPLTFGRARIIIYHVPSFGPDDGW